MKSIQMEEVVQMDESYYSITDVLKTKARHLKVGSVIYSTDEKRTVKIVDLKQALKNGKMTTFVKYDFVDESVTTDEVDLSNPDSMDDWVNGMMEPASGGNRHRNKTNVERGVATLSDALKRLL